MKLGMSLIGVSEGPDQREKTCICRHSEDRVLRKLRRFKRMVAIPMFSADAKVEERGGFW